MLTDSHPDQRHEVRRNTTRFTPSTAGAERHHGPRLHVTTGNITNDALLDLMRNHLGEVERAFKLSGYVEMTIAVGTALAGSPPRTDPSVRC